MEYLVPSLSPPRTRLVPSNLPTGSRKGSRQMDLLAAPAKIHPGYAPPSRRPRNLCFSTRRESSRHRLVRHPASARATASLSPSQEQVVMLGYSSFHLVTSSEMQPPAGAD